jgi:phosphoribosylanthranilate isomerase
VRDEARARAATDAGDDEAVVIVLTFGLPESPRQVDARTAEEWSARANRKSLADVARWLR